MHDARCLEQQTETGCDGSGCRGGLLRGDDDGVTQRIGQGVACGLCVFDHVPREIDEAALIDGTTPTQHFWHVLLPQLMSVIALLAVMRFIMTFNKFDDVYLLTGGTAGTDIAAVRVYDYLTGRFDAGGAAAQAVVLSLVMAVFLIVYLRFMARHEGQED